MATNKEDSVHTKIIEGLRENPDVEINRENRTVKPMEKGFGLKFYNRLLLFLLFAALSFIVIQNMGLQDLLLTSSDPPPKTTQNYQTAVDNFLKDLNSPAKPKAEVHQALYTYLTGLQKDKTASAAKFETYIATKDIPYDYTYFFKECMPEYVKPSKAKGQKIVDENILLSLPEGTNFTANLTFNTNATPVAKIEEKLPKNTRNKRLAFTGTYTSPFKMPVGLAINKGEVVNPALQKWDGLLIIDREGKMYIDNASSLAYNFKNYAIKNKYNDYLTFLKMAQKEQFSVIQSHLLIDDGKVLIEDTENQKKFRRRIVFQTADNGIHIYDSKVEELTFYEAATRIKDKFKATRAINLDMGTYNYCKFFADNVATADLSHLDKGVVLSNLITVDY